MTGIWVSHWAGRYLEAVLWSKFVAKKSVKYLEVSLKVYTFAPVKQKGHGRVAQLNRVADYGSAGYRFESCRGHSSKLLLGRVAQLNRVADYGSAGYRFESCRDH